MKSFSHSVLVASAAAATTLAPTSARADVVIVESHINQGNAGVSVVARPALVLGDGIQETKVHAHGDGVSSYDDTVELDRTGFGVHVKAKARQTTSITPTGDSLLIVSGVQVDASRTRSGVQRTDEASAAGASESLVVRFTVSKPSTYTISGVIGRGGPGGGSVGFPDGSVVLLQEGLDPASLPLDESGTIPVGQTVTFNVQLTGGTGGGVGTPATGTLTWNFSLQVSPTTPPGDDRDWTKPGGGAFGTTDNWSPQEVPVKDDDHDENAVFAVSGTYSVEFAAAKVKALGPARHANRLEVLRGIVTMDAANLLVDELALDHPSLVVDGATLTIASGQLTSNSATIGDVHDTDADLVVDGPDSAWNCQGRLRVGGSDGTAGDGKLTITHGAHVTSVDTRIGAGGGQGGFASIRGTGSTWNTDDVHVGFSGVGAVEIEDGAVVTSAIAQVGTGFDVGGSGSRGSDVPSGVVVEGVDAGGTSSEWDAQTLTLAQNSLVSVDGGARIAANSVGTVAGGFLEIDGFDPAHDRPSTLGCTSITVFGGALALSGGGEVDVVNDVTVAALDVSGAMITVEGLDAATNTPSLLSADGTIHVGILNSAGAVELRDSGEVDCGTLLVGTESGSAGIVLIDGPSMWSARGTAQIGGSELDEPPSAGVVVMNGGILQALGDIFVSETGSIQGYGLIAAPTITVAGHLTPAIIQLSGGPAAPTKAKSKPVRHGSTLTIQGDLVVEPTGVVRIDVGGPESDRVVVTGAATLDGTLVLQFMGGFAPKQGAQFDVVHVDGATNGDFATVDVRGLAPGAQFTTAVAGGTRTMTAVNAAKPLPTVSISPAAKRVKEKSKKPAVFKLTRKGDASQELTVNYLVGGTADNGLDYVTLSGEVTIPARKRSAKLPVTILDDKVHEGDESLTMTVVPGGNYTHAFASTAQVTIRDDD